MRNKLITALIILSLPTAAYATPRPRASDTPGVGTDVWDTCTVSQMALARAPNVWSVSWHDCLL